MSTVIKDLGAVSAYAYAVEKGYTGTEAEFAELMADYAEVGQRAEDAAESALNSKTAAQAAQTAAETAQGKAEDAQAAAESVAESIPSDYSQLSEDVSDLKEGLANIEDGTSVLVTQGYFSNDYKSVNNSFGTYTYKYLADENVFLMNRDETAGTKAISIGMNDSGLTLAQRLVSVADYPVCLVHVDTNIPQAASPKFRIFTYQSNGTTMNHDWYVDITSNSGDYIIDIAKKVDDNHWSNDVYYVVQQVTSSSYTYDFAPYVHVTSYGFFTVEQAYNHNLKEIITNVRASIATLENDTVENSESITALSALAEAIGEKAATGAPVTITRKAGYLIDNGTYYDTTNGVSSVTNKIKCAEGDVFYYYGRCVDSVVTAMWFKEDGSILSTEKIAGGGYANHIFTAPENAYSVIFTSFDSASASVDYSPGLSVTQQVNYISPLSHKKWYPCGDSFTYGEFTGLSDSKFLNGKYAGKSKTYPYHIGNRTNINVFRASTSGETMASYSGGTVVFSSPTYDFGYKSIPNDADIITLWFGINDSGHNIPIGTINDDDNTTFYGAWNVVLDDLITRCTKAHIGIIVSNNLAQAYVDAVIAIAKKWGIPYLDLNYDENVPLMHYSLRPTASDAIKARRNAQFAISANNHHPNLLAHEYESYFIEKWLLSL